MTLTAKILAGAAALCFLLWAGFLALGVQPLVPAGGIAVIYGEHEDFFSDGRAFRRVRNDSLLLLHLPHARPGQQWWTVDFQDRAIARSRAPRSLKGRLFALRGDLAGDRLAADGAWRWHVTGDGASFSGGSLTCSVRKTRN